MGHSTDKHSNPYKNVMPKGVGDLDMVIAFDTTGSMAAYIDDVRRQVTEMIPRLFKDNENLRIGIVAFGDYCDMVNAQEFGNAYQVVPLTDNENELIRFVREANNTNGGDGDEFYELVLKKIIDEMPWRENAQKCILLIADAAPHPLGYTYKDYVVGNQIDWEVEAQRAANMMIRIDTVSIRGLAWYKELSDMTNGICVRFRSSSKTSDLVETVTTARSLMSMHHHMRSPELSDEERETSREKYSELRKRFSLHDYAEDEELSCVHDAFESEIDRAEAEAEDDSIIS